MEGKIVVNHLKKDELIYELKIRGVDSEGLKVIEMRATLRSLLRLEQSGASLTTETLSLDAGKELDGISVQLVELTQTAKATLSVLEVKRLQTRVMHYLRRLNKISTSGLDERLTKCRTTLLTNTLLLLDNLASHGLRRRESLNVSTVLPTNSNEDHESDELSSTEDESDPVVTSRLPVVSDQGASTSRFLPVSKWNVKFSGDGKGLSVHSFLERVNELRMARQVSTLELFRSAIDLFESKALIWYRSNRRRVSSWQELTALLLEHYEPPDYRPRLFQEILGRTQAVTESIVDYLTCMSALFNRYGQIPEEVKLDIVLRNLAPFYQMQLPVVRTIQELETECRQLEVRKHRIDTYKPPPTKPTQCLEPDFACVQPSFQEPSAAATLAEPSRAAVRQPTCYNCRQQGHLYYNCTAPKNFRCFKCGYANVTVRTCPRCSGNEPRRS